MAEYRAVLKEKVINGEEIYRRAALVLVLSGLSLLYGASIAALATESVTDFPTFYVSARHVWAGQDIYAQSAADLAMVPPGKDGLAEPLNPNLNPPFQSLLLAPLGLLSYPAAFSIWSLLSLAFGVVGAAALVAATGSLRAGSWRVLAMLALVFAYFPTWASIVYGQFGLAMFFFLALAWYGARNGREGIAGVSLGLALSIKPFVAIFVLFFLLRRRWRLLAWLGGTTAACALAGLAIFGWEPHRHYLSVLGGTNWYAASWNASLLGFFSRVFGGSNNVPLVDAPLLAHSLADAGSFVVIGAMVWLARPQAIALSPRRFDLAFAFTVVTMLLVSPLGWMYYFPILAIPALVLWSSGSRRAVVVAWLLSTVPHLLVPSSRFNDPLSWFTWAGVYFYALLLFAGLLAYRAWSVAERQRGPAESPARPLVWRGPRQTTQGRPSAS